MKYRNKGKKPDLVCKSGFFNGWGGGIRTHAYSSQSAVSYRLTTPQYRNMKGSVADHRTGRKNQIKKNRKIGGPCDKWGG